MAALTGYLASLLMGLAAGAAYGLVQVRSPAPPIIALIGLFGMVLGEQAVDVAKRHFVPPAQTSIQHDVDGTQGYDGRQNARHVRVTVKSPKAKRLFSGAVQSGAPL